jgi:hypothetical protein
LDLRKITRSSTEQTRLERRNIYASRPKRTPLQAEAAEQVRVWLAIADGTMTEEQVADWIRKHI